jgi:hypothetical protein
VEGHLRKVSRNFSVRVCACKGCTYIAIDSCIGSISRPSLILLLVSPLICSPRPFPSLSEPTFATHSPYEAVGYDGGELAQGRLCRAAGENEENEAWEEAHGGVVSHFSS